MHSLAPALAAPLLAPGEAAPVAGFCSVFVLRSVNTLFAAATAVIVFLLLRKLHYSPSGSGGDRASEGAAAVRAEGGTAFGAVMLLLRAAHVLLLPTHAFFYSLFYTDAGAVFFVLLTYYLSVLATDKHIELCRVGQALRLHNMSSQGQSQDQNKKADATVTVTFTSRLCYVFLAVSCGVAGAVSVLFRQTNVVWAGFILALSLIRTLTATTSDNTSVESNSSSSSLSDSNSNSNSRVSSQAQSPSTLLTEMPLWQQPFLLLRALLSRPALLLLHQLPLLAVVAAFGVFVQVNGGITVGDKENHVAGLHLMQPWYLALFTLSAVSPAAVLTVFVNVINTVMTLPGPQVDAQQVNNAENKGNNTKNAIEARSLKSVLFIIAFIVVLTVVAVICARYGTVVHVFILADNRHLPFYLYRRLWGLWWWVKYALAPMYAVCAVLIDRTLNATHAINTDISNGGAKNGENKNAATVTEHSHVAVATSPLVRVLFYLACAAALVPSPLVEFRYFTLPWFWVALHQPLLMCSQLLPCAQPQSCAAQSSSQPRACSVQSQLPSVRGAQSAGDERKSADASESAANKNMNSSNAVAAAACASPNTNGLALVQLVISVLWLFLFVVVNAAAWYVFLYKPFTWPDGSVARFMW